MRWWDGAANLNPICSGAGMGCSPLPRHTRPWHSQGCPDPSWAPPARSHSLPSLAPTGRSTGCAPAHPTRHRTRHQLWCHQKPSQANSGTHTPTAIPTHPTPLGTKCQAPRDAAARHHPVRTAPVGLFISVLMFLIRAEGASWLLHIYARRIARIRARRRGQE